MLSTDRRTSRVVAAFEMSRSRHTMWLVFYADARQDRLAPNVDRRVSSAPAGAVYAGPHGTCLAPMGRAACQPDDGCERMRRHQAASRNRLCVPKVFGIGFHKTGTTSLRDALTRLGYSVAGPNGLKDPNIAHNARSLVFRIAERYDAFQDNPWPLLYRELDERYPGSKFVLTLRPADAWIESQVRYFGEETSPMREWIYGVGCPKGNEAIYVARYEQHNREVLEYFSRRPDDLLVLTVSDGDGWDKLCAFLKKDIPNVPFPHSNRAEDGGAELRFVRQRILRRAGRLVSRLAGN